MSHDPRVERFYDEARAAKKELRRIAIDIAAHRIEHSDLPSFPTSRQSISSAVIPDVTWALENGRTDLAARLIELIDQYNNSMGTAAMMAVRIEAELHMKAVQAREEGDVPDYLDDESDDPVVIRLSPEDAQAAFSSFEPEEEE